MASSQPLPAATQQESSYRVSFLDTAFIIGFLSALKFVLHLLVNGRYGYFRDELYYIACSHHLSWGYVDQPPMIAVTVRLSHILLGDSLLALRLFASLAMIAVTALALLAVRELGGGKFAMWLTGLCLFVGPIWLNFGYLMTMNSYEHVIWTACGLLVIRYLNTRNPRLWLWFGVLCGVGLETKYSITVYGFAVVLGLLLTRERRIFLNRWIWLGGLAALIVFLPNLVWNIRYHWPFVELMRNIRAEGRDVVLSPGQFLFQQAILSLPISAFVWIAGVLWLMFSRSGSRYRVVGWTFVIVIGTFMVLHGKNYYSMPIYPIMFAAGAVALESWIWKPGWRWIGWAYGASVLAMGIIFMPISIPILPVDSYLKYQEKLPIQPPRSEYSHEHAALPQIYADQFGWTEIVQATAQAWNQIPAAERSDCAIFAQDYGSAAAIDFWGPKYGLPHVISGHQSYFLWGPRHYSGNCMIVLDDRPERLHQLFEDVQYVTTSAPNRYALESELPVYICRTPKSNFRTLQEAWAMLKKWR
jgi:hypothetical protein